MRKVFITLALVLSALSAQAQDFFYYENEDGTLTITHAGERWHGPSNDQHYGTCHSYSGDIVIPEKINGKTVTAVGKLAFYRCEITSVKLPSTLKLIDDEAFSQSPNVKELTIPASVDSIGKAAFNSWDALESVTIEDSPNVLHTGWGGYSVMSSMFSDQPLLKKAYMGRDHTSPFYGSMGWEVNLFGRSHLEEITYGDYVTEIQKHELIGCSSLKKVVLGKNIRSIGNFAFDGCVLLSDIAIPDGVEEIGQRAFNDCQVMPTQKMPSQLRSIGMEAFRRCFALTSVAIPASVLTIGNYAFSECNGITSFTLENSPNTIQLPNRMFDNLRNLTTFYIGRNYSAEYDWYGNAFSNHPALLKATVGGEVTEVQNQMFNGCKLLKEITLGDKITRIGIDAFNGCDVLENINLPEPITEIGARAFYRCFALKSAPLPSQLEQIGEDAYSECRALTALTIPASVQTVGRNAFTSCNGVLTLTLEDSPNTIQLYNRMFDNFRGLTTFYIGRNYSAEYDWYGNAFSNHPALLKATVGGEVTEVQNQMFNGCKLLKEVKLGDKITRIGTDAFNGCDVLENINLPESLTQIDKRAFYRCYAIKSPQLPSALNNLGEEAYNGCPIETIHIPASVGTIGRNAFCSTKMKDIYCYGTVPPVCDGWLFDGLNKDNMTLHYPKGSLDAYKAAVCWKEFFDDHAAEFESPAGINNITIDGIYDGRTYDLQGRRIEGQPARRGIYIINGKKIFK